MHVVTRKQAFHQSFQALQKLECTLKQFCVPELLLSFLGYVSQGINRLLRCRTKTSDMRWMQREVDVWYVSFRELGTEYVESVSIVISVLRTEWIEAVCTHHYINDVVTSTLKLDGTRCPQKKIYPSTLEHAKPVVVNVVSDASSAHYPSILYFVGTALTSFVISAHRRLVLLPAEYLPQSSSRSTQYLSQPGQAAYVFFDRQCTRGSDYLLAGYREIKLYNPSITPNAQSYLLIAESLARLACLALIAQGTKSRHNNGTWRQTTRLQPRP